MKPSFGFLKNGNVKKNQDCIIYKYNIVEHRHGNTDYLLLSDVRWNLDILYFFSVCIIIKVQFIWP